MDAAGTIPVVQDFTDPVSAVVSLTQGDYAGAGLALTGMIPGVGEAADIAKAARDVKTLVKDTEGAAHVAGEAKSAEGIVYKRTNPKTGEEYVGQAKSPERFDARQGEHDAKIGVQHKYTVLGRADPGKDLDVLEETQIRLNGGLQKEGGTLANKRHQMSQQNYSAAGGTTPK